MKKSAREYRYDLITIIYKHQLLEDEINIPLLVKEYELTPLQAKQLEIYNEKYAFLEGIISKNLSKNWTFIRINFLLRAILLLGTIELIYSNPKIIINEMIEIARDYSFSEREVKFVNGILDSIRREISDIKKRTNAES
ncbi:transcription antitermination factor NusB [Mycoplasma phocimorsus]|uniref:Transcription antitermination factor NusB n=1 Tax=Mycoplasma phocimorsus TaxID=3045839 RepID=A0AAJ1PRJ8_9MOLU|nr:transcription antitermination factor NusB [Mycoplasma phocimorsus]MDJ1645541.1 transcription antitermination factor NusB [Mycoplasma phocimorsus]MDJ1646616.1 transcription antitermination factor NusB [Mycoplasma phocimorsus]MDJ1647110.1 transcription antitermination factor NusB [Mycoplasma phocimorsus]MDJ1648087.1 transcription antitermination factor NusB [Mycoplasma phocimorsus]MDJ1648976.1 transcription antitermination factor NusB [Mycoplasma phocimorsus]